MSFKQSGAYRKCLFINLSTTGVEATRVLDKFTCGALSHEIVCFLAMWRRRWAFCLNFQSQCVHWNLGSTPHSFFVWCLRPFLVLQSLPHREHSFTRRWAGKSKPGGESHLLPQPGGVVPALPYKPGKVDANPRGL